MNTVLLSRPYDGLVLLVKVFKYDTYSAILYCFFFDVSMWWIYIIVIRGRLDLGLAWLPGYKHVGWSVEHAVGQSAEILGSDWLKAKLT